MKGRVTRRGAGWQYVVDVGADPATGRRRQRSKGGFPTRKEAEKALAKVNHEVNAGVFTAPARVTFKEFADNTWLPAVKATVRPSTERNYSQVVRLYLTPRIGGLRLEAITPAHLNAVYGELLDSGRDDGEGGLSTRTVRQVHVVAHRMLKDAVRWGLLGRNPVDAADPPSVTSPELRVWSPEELRMFLENVSAERLYPLFVLAATTGMRRGELMGLTWDDVDFENARLSINRARVVVRHEVVDSAPKTARSRRTVALDPGTLGVLRTWRKHQREERLLMGAGWRNTINHVFTWPDGEPVHPSVVSQTFTRLVRKHKLPALSFHGLRHTAATAALAGGLSPKIVSDRLGHASVSITLDTYSHVLPAMDEHAAAVISGLVLPTNVSNL